MTCSSGTCVPPGLTLSTTIRVWPLDVGVGDAPLTDSRGLGGVLLAGRLGCDPSERDIMPESKKPVPLPTRGC